METPPPGILALIQQYEHLSADVQAQVQQVHLFQKRLYETIAPSLITLQKRLHRLPGPPSSYYWHIFRDYWRSYELFSEKLASTAQQLSRPYETPPLCATNPTAQNEDDWAELVDDLEEVYVYQRQQQVQRAMLLLLVDVLDSTERIGMLRIPHAHNSGEAFVKSIYGLRQITLKLNRMLETALSDYGIQRVPLFPGQYPPPETTRIIARRDNNTDDNVVIIEIATTGYRWQGGLLRKADVIVATEPTGA